MTNQPQPIPPGMERPPGLPTSPPPPRVDKAPDIRLTIYLDAANPVHVPGFATVEQAIEQGNEWQGRLWWRVTIDGRTVAEEPKGAKR